MTVLLPTHRVPKVWGRKKLPPPFIDAGNQAVGEIWFNPPADFAALLVKYLFTSDKLSVQVHPNDAQAPAGHRGKEECWLILDAEPGARLAVGLAAPVSEERLRRAALDGSIEQLLSWHRVKAGDFFYLPAGTIHAVGPGLALVEVQQNSDITFRLYDYGRPRELHLDEALAVAERIPYSAQLHRSIPTAGEIALVDGPHFRLDRIDGVPSAALAERYAGKLLLIPLEGDYAAGGTAVPPGSCALVDAVGDIGCTAGKAMIAQPCR